MFSFLKRKPKLNNETNEDLAKMLCDNPEDPVINSEYFKNKSMNYSIESLEHLDHYLEGLRAELPEDEVLIKVALRSGSYLGEVIRRQSNENYNWLKFSEAEKLNTYIKDIGYQLGTAMILWSEPENFFFPIAKVLKRLENGSEDSLVSFAKVSIEGIPE